MDRKSEDALLSGIEITDTDAEIIEAIRSACLHSFLTGSARWGCKKPNDIDIVVWNERDAVASEVKSRVSAALIAQGGGSLGSLTFTDSNGIISSVNIICVNECDYAYWQIATEMMGMLPYVANRVMRHAIFETLRALAKLALGDDKAKCGQYNNERAP